MIRTRLAAQFREDAARAMTMAPRELLRGAGRRIGRALARRYRRHRDRRSDTGTAESPPRIVYKFFPAVNGPQAAVENYLAHRFDLLGSGWTRVSHGMHCRGLQGERVQGGAPSFPDQDGDWLTERLLPAHVARARSIWRLVDWGYDAIDWQLDFKSGHRWSERTWYGDIRLGPPPADVKVPWELGRGYHLPQLALAGTASERPALAHVREFRNQVLDFVASNPPRMGVQWHCSMDVAIRVVNWLVALDIFQARGVTFDAEFLDVFSRSVFEHGLHLIQNLEYTADYRANHYLANIAGLLFVAAYLECTATTDAWLAFAVQQLIREVPRQFYSDGTNFEGSTAYHRLSAEIAVYCSALVLGLPPEKQQAWRRADQRRLNAGPGLLREPLPEFELPGTSRRSPFSPSYLQRLEQMAEFVMSITKPQGHVVQIGDNDSGRFLKLSATHERLTVGQARQNYAHLADYDELPEAADYWDERILDQRHLVAAANGLFARTDFAAHVGSWDLETRIVRHLAGWRDEERIVTGPPNRRLRAVCSGIELCSRIWSEGVQPFDHGDAFSQKAQRRHVYQFPAPRANLRDGLELHAYWEFGLFIYRSPTLFLAIRAEQSPPLAMSRGHRHHDALCVELTLDGHDVLLDPGSYLYTASPAQRQRYRAREAHFVPRLSANARGDRPDPLFRLSRPDQVVVQYVGHDRFQAAGRTASGGIYRRTVHILSDRVIIEDEGDLDAASAAPDAPLPFSPGYGMMRSPASDSLRRVA
jgi:hypothetical protein